MGARSEFAALTVLETTGYSEMRISDICTVAGVALVSRIKDSSMSHGLS